MYQRLGLSIREDADTPSPEAASRPTVGLFGFEQDIWNDVGRMSESVVQGHENSGRCGAYPREQ